MLYEFLFKADYISIMQETYKQEVPFPFELNLL